MSEPQDRTRFRLGIGAAIFFSFLILAVVGSISFIESAWFAGWVKRAIYTYTPRNLGIRGEFQNLEIGYFPPTLKVLAPSIRFELGNIAGVPAGTKVLGESLELRFRPIQVFTGKIRVHEVALVKGHVTLPKLPQTKSASKQDTGSAITLSTFLEIRTDSISLEDSTLDIEDESVAISRLKLFQETRNSDLGYAFIADLREGTRGLSRMIPASVPLVDQLQVNGFFSAKALVLDRAFAKILGITIDGNGHVDGDLFQSKLLPFRSEWKVSGDVPSKIASYSLDEFKGSIDAAFKVSGELTHPKETLAGEVALRGDHLRWKAWNLGSLKTAFQFKSGDSISIEEFFLTEPEQERDVVNKGQNRPGDGGTISIKPVRLPWGLVDQSEISRSKISRNEIPPFSIPIEVSRAHVHWLAFPAIKSIYALDMRATGSVNAIWDGSHWSAGLKLKVPDFKFDNQSWITPGKNKPRPRRAIIEVPEVLISGKAELNNEEVKFVPVVLDVGKTKLEVFGGVHFVHGMEFSSKTQIHLGDFDKILENPIRGDGSLTVRVHGPVSNVLLDFNVGLQNAEYLGLHLGSLNGTMQLSEAEGEFRFQQISAQQGETRYRANGMIPAGSDKEALLNFDIPEGRLQDLTHILDPLLSKLEIFPNDLSGSAQGHVQLRGELSVDGLIINGDLRGREWVAYGESFSQGDLKIVYDRGRYEIGPVRLSKRKGIVLGSMQFNSTTKELGWDVQSSGIRISDLDRLGTSDLSQAGELAIHSSGRTNPRSRALKSETQVHLTGFRLLGRNYGDAQAFARTEDGVLSVAVDGFNGAVHADYHAEQVRSAGGSVDSPMASFERNRRINFVANQWDWSPLFAGGNASMQESRSQLTGSVGLSWLGNHPTLSDAALSGEIFLEDAWIEARGRRFGLENSFKLGVTNGNFPTQEFRLVGQDSALTVNVSARRGELDGQIEGAIDLAPLEMLVPFLQKTSGRLTVDLGLEGELLSPQVYGRGDLERASFQIKGIDSPFENIRTDWEFEKQKLVFRRLNADVGTGHVGGQGQIEFVGFTPSIDMNFELKDPVLRIFPFIRIKPQGNVKLKGVGKPYTLSGSLTVSEGLIVESLTHQRGTTAQKVLRYAPKQSDLNTTTEDSLRLDLHVLAERGIRVRNELIDCEAKGELQITGTPSNPGLVGGAETLSGRLFFRDRVFQLQSGLIRFTESGIFDPELSASAHTEVGDTKVQLNISGKKSNWKADLTSRPSLPESEILSLLVLGSTRTELDQLRTGDRTYVQRSDAASLLLHSLQFNQSIQESTGFEVSISEANMSAYGNSAFTPQGSGGSLSAAPKVVIRRPFGKKLDLSVGSTLGFGSLRQNDVNAEYRLSPGFSVQGAYSYTEDTAGRAYQQNSLGIDLKLQTRFR